MEMVILHFIQMVSNKHSTNIAQLLCNDNTDTMLYMSSAGHSGRVAISTLNNFGSHTGKVTIGLKQLYPASDSTRHFKQVQLFKNCHATLFIMKQVGSNYKNLGSGGAGC